MSVVHLDGSGSQVQSPRGRADPSLLNAFQWYSHFVHLDGSGSQVHSPRGRADPSSLNAFQWYSHFSIGKGLPILLKYNYHVMLKLL